MKLWQKITLAILTLTAGSVGLARNVDIDAAKQRLNHILQRAEIASSPVLPDQYDAVDLPDLDLSHYALPNAPYYGETITDNQSVDPFVVAEKFRAKIKPNTQLSKTADLLVFVSFSMPEASLKRIAVETAKAGGVMVLRGFKDNSLKHTIHAVEEVAALQGDLLIHPDLFDHYQITEVPTTVLAKAGDEVSCGSNAEDDTGLCTAHYQVKGDVSLHAALEYFLTLKHDSELDAMAQAKLANLRGIK